MNSIKSLINKSEAAFPEWKKLTAWKRAELLKVWYDLILKNKQKIAKLMHDETGKLLEESLAEVDYAASFIIWSAEEAKRVYGEIIPTPAATRGLILKEPVGVVAAITPWNFPAAMITRKVAPALAVGCPVICKPSSASAKTAIYLHKLAMQAGIPADVFQVVTGDAAKIGEEFCKNDKVKKLSFTGSTATGKILMAQSASTIKKITMELGGNAPFIVFEDADLEKAAEGMIKSRFRYSGQTCICANRILVHEKIYDKFAKLAVTKAKKLKLAPLINLDAVKKVEKLIKSSSGKILCGGKSKGRYFEPTVIANVTPDMEIYKQEIFGPVATLVKFKTEKQAIDLANGTEYGLAAYIYSGDTARGQRVAEAIDFGMIGVNDIAVGNAYSPFGGYKHSGFGREGSHYGLEEFLEIKFISVA